MLRQRLSLVFTLMLPSLDVLSVSPDELRELSGVTDRAAQQRSNRAKSDDVKMLIPPAKPAGQSEPVSNKYTPPSGTGGAMHTSPAHSGQVPNNESNYLPPPRGTGATKDVIYSDSVKATYEFGIRLGTWLEATLDRDSSSAEPGLIELRLSKDVNGHKRILGAGTLIYASKTLNGSTKRMELTTVKGITPEGHEFSIKGQVFDIQKVSGLNGVMHLDQEQIAKHSITSGALSAVSAAGRAVLPTNPAAAALRGATETALTDTNRVSEFNNAQRAVIYVSPQPLLIRVDEKF